MCVSVSECAGEKRVVGMERVGVVTVNGRVTCARLGYLGSSAHDRSLSWMHRVKP